MNKPLYEEIAEIIMSKEEYINPHMLIEIQDALIKYNDSIENTATMDKLSDFIIDMFEM